MRCKRCRTPLEEDMRFCPECGYPAEPDDADVPLHTASGAAPERDAADDEAEDLEAFRLLAAQLDVMEPDNAPEQDSADPATRAIRAAQNRSDAVDYYTVTPHEPTVPAQPPMPRPYRAPEGASQAHLRPKSVVIPTPPEADTAPEEGERGTDDFGDGYTVQPADSMGKYRRTSAGKRFGSILLCILTAVMLIFTVLSLSLRLTLTKTNIRSAADAQGLQTKSVITDKGIMTALEYLNRKLGSDSPRDDGMTGEQQKELLGAGTFSALTAEVLNDYADYFLRDGKPTVLNAAYICGALNGINEEFSAVYGYDVKVFDTDAAAERINGGDLSWLSIDDEGGYFYRRYDFNPKIAATVGSLPILILCGAIALLCIVLIFAINSSNLPAGLNFNGAVMLIVGGFWLSAALGCLILSLIRNIWVLTDLLRSTAMWTGIFGGGLFALGLIAVLIAGALKKRARRHIAEAQE